MKKNRILLVLMGLAILTACNSTLSEAAVQTAVSEAIMTSSADSEKQEKQETEEQSQQEIEMMRNQLTDAQLLLTEQANQIVKLQEDLNRVYLLLTPTLTEIPPDTPAPTVGPTNTPEPTSTIAGGLLYNQKYVVVSTGAPLYTFTERNKAGAPIMVKPDPIKKFETGDKIIVDWHVIIGDGGIQYYLVQGPIHSGLYIRVDQVYDYTGP